MHARLVAVWAVAFTILGMGTALFDPAFLKKLEMLTLSARQLFRGDTRGERRSTVHGASVEFADFRPYVQGDDFRRIDWNAYAKFESLMLRLFVEEQELAVHILLDCSASMDYGAGADGGSGGGGR